MIVSLLFLSHANVVRFFYAIHLEVANDGTDTRVISTPVDTLTALISFVSSISVDKLAVKLQIYATLRSRRKLAFVEISVKSSDRQLLK